VTALRDVARFLEVLSLLGYDRDKISLVLSHCYHRSDVKLKEMERALGYPVVETIQYAPSQVTASINRGLPLVQEYKDSPAAQNIIRLAEFLAAKSARQEQTGLEGGLVRGKKEKAKRRGLFFQRKPAADGVGS
jgi:Flp pilus assembly CpaE family ATPase